MRELFVIDKKNYKPNGSVGTRPSVRGIIIRDGKIAMMHSKKYDYYKLPGGGMEKSEEYTETLIREVKEESGLVVIPETIKEFGYVRRIEKGMFEDIFIQDNYYFICEVLDEVSNQELDDYEADEGFALEFVLPEYAIKVNENANQYDKDDKLIYESMIVRENRVLRIIKEEIIG